MICDSDHENLVKERLAELFYAFSEGDRVKVFSCLSTSFQRRFPLHSFLRHERFDTFPGNLLDVLEIDVNRDEKTAIATVMLEDGAGTCVKSIYLEMDSDGWKVEAGLYDE